MLLYLGPLIVNLRYSANVIDIGRKFINSSARLLETVQKEEGRNNVQSKVYIVDR